MPRPPKCRRVAFLPGVSYFKPAGIPLRALEEVRLSVEEAEAIRLKELVELDQELAAEKMNVSRPTFQRVLAGARWKIADALVNGKAIRIEGGNYELAKPPAACGRGQDPLTVSPSCCEGDKPGTPVGRPGEPLRRRCRRRRMGGVHQEPTAG